MLYSPFSFRKVDLSAYSDEVFRFWQDGAPGWAPSSVTTILNSARLDWLSSLTQTLNIWRAKGFIMNSGELLLGYANLGSLVEGWLKLFYCVYYEEYLRAPKTNNSGMIAPNDLKFELLKQYSCSRLWDNQCDAWHQWVEKIQSRRNAIHAFNDRDIGTAVEFQEDLQKFEQFIILINTRLPYPD